MEAAAEDEGDSRGNPTKRKAWSRESPNKRRRKNRERKREARARAAARRPPGHTSSSEDEQPGEISGIPQFFSAFPLNSRAREDISTKTASSAPAQQPRDLASNAMDVQEKSGDTPQEQRSPIPDGTWGGESSGAEDWRRGERTGDNEEGTGGNEGSIGSDRKSQGNPGNSPEPSANNPSSSDESNHGEGGVGERNLGDRADAGQGPGTPGENPELCQPLLDNPTSSESFALAIAKVKGTSHVSDAAVDKILQAAMDHMDVMREFWENRGSSRLYTKRLRPSLEPFIPTVYSGLLLEEKKPTGLEYRHIDGLTGIPKEYSEGTGKTRVIREEAYVTLHDIKRHYMGVNAKWNMTTETAKEHFRNAALSIDGVQESHKGKKSFTSSPSAWASLSSYTKSSTPSSGTQRRNPV